jgi:hypothetical protein
VTFKDILNFVVKFLNLKRVWQKTTILYSAQEMPRVKAIVNKKGKDGHKTWFAVAVCC